MNHAIENLLRQLALPTEDTTPLSVRLMYALQIVHCYAKGVMPLHREGLSADEFLWVDAVCDAISEYQPRPPHPDPRIEDFLQNMFPTPEQDR